MKYRLSNKEIQSVLNSDIDSRVRYFVHKVADWKKMWLMGNKNSFFTDKNSNDEEVLVIWPFREYAEISLKDRLHFQEQLIEMDIHFFLENFIEYLLKKNVKIFMFPGEEMDGAIMTAESFKNMMEEELDRME
ncbi:MAG: DUF2750 domain-containing protein [Holosporaceae bacterium]|jgi:hypothetical protein|nr:DUF2750 domain-containing protein [Holosporaceae bacterium]